MALLSVPSQVLREIISLTQQKVPHGLKNLASPLQIDHELAKVISLNMAGNPDGLIKYSVEKGRKWIGEYNGDDAPASWNCMRYFLTLHYDVYTVELPADVIYLSDGICSCYGQKVSPESLQVEVVMPRFEVIGKPVVISWGND